VTTKNDIFEGLHVLLVTEDDGRAQALSKALRDRKAHVGDVKAGARDPVALRGADLLLVDQRTADVTKSRVSEMRADVRARWASVCTLDFGKLVLDDGAIYLSQLEEAVLPLIAGDKALTERARKEGVFEATLAPLGPSRTLRALALAGPTLHVELSQGQVHATLCLSNELLVCAFVERGDERYEAWAALARILGLTDAVMNVEKRAHPTAMNIMEPINQALEVAAQERQSTANLRPVELPKPAQQRGEAAEAPANSAAAVAAQAKSAAASGAGAKRTLLGMSPGLAGVVRPPAAPPASSGYSLRQDAGERPAERPAAAKGTILGMKAPVLAKPASENEVPPATAPVLGRAAMPANDIALPGSEPEGGQKRKSRPELQPVRLDDDLLPRAKSTPELSNMGARGFRDRHKAPGRMDTVPQPTAQRPRSRPELKPVELPEEPVTVPPKSMASSKGSTMEKAAASAAGKLGSAAIITSAHDEDLTIQGNVLDRATFGDQPTDPSMQSLPAHLLEEARRPDLPALPIPQPPGSAQKLDELKSMAGDRPPELSPDAEVREQAITRPFDSSSLMAAIEEEQPFAGNEGAQQLLDAVVRKRVQEETLIVVRREKRKSRAILLFVLFLVVVGEYFALQWFEQQGQQRAQPEDTTLAPVGRAKTPTRATPAAAPQADPSAPAAAEAVAPAVEGAKEPEKAADAKPGAARPVEPAAQAAQPEAPVAAPVPAEKTPPEPAVEAPVAAPAAPAEGSAVPAGTVSSDALVKSGLELLESGNAALARTYLQQATVADTKNAHAFAGLAESELALNEPRAALQHIEQAIRLRPKRARYRVTQGDALKMLGKAEDAHSAYQKALEIDPTDREANKRLAP
jgi:hypothetical protein